MKRPLIIGLLSAAVLFVLAGIAAVVFFSLRSGDFAAFNVPLVYASAEENKTFNVDMEKPVSLRVESNAGDVIIVGADVEAVQVQIVKTGYGTNEARAETALKSIQYDVRQQGNTISLIYQLSGRQTREVNTVDFIITVPRNTQVEVDNGFGVVDVADLKGSVDISGDFGDVAVKNIEGSLRLDNSSGEVRINNVNAGAQDVRVEVDFGKIVLEKVNAKNIRVDSDSGTLSLTNVRASGDLFAGSKFGNLAFENGSAAALTIESSSGKVTLTKVNIRGILAITSDFGDVTLNQTIASSYDINSNSGGISLSGAGGSIKAHTDFGDITVEKAENATLDLHTKSGGIEFSGSLGSGPHNVQSDFGGITLTIPAGSALNVDLKTDFGSITSEIPLTVTLNGSGNDRQTGTMNGGGAMLIVRTKNGPISINAIK